ncbi:putative pentatricopeptide repeat-containing protein At5g08310, mitochondrial [Phalaenopsis equestris]|uniref:putative pentatricopeptide repeat-containing protein At5g08310, mitochondrial n=1 Tax=Phalaenopsis equestris TaxID=78828 RepID=UPI0009E50B21|nr:putative pentatricopeptide repeat-containing protein At5g08310, mitochondrial [Phalaenopsis equestris]
MLHCAVKFTAPPLLQPIFGFRLMALRILSSRSKRSLPSLSYPSNPSSPSHPQGSSSSIDSSSLSHNQLAHELFDVFSQPPNLRDSDVLRNLGRRLTLETVEIVLKDLRGWRAAHEFFRWASWQEGFRHSCYTYNAMAERLSRARRRTQLKALARELVGHRCPMTPGALGFLIRCLGRQGLAEDAEFVFDHANDLSCIPNSYTYNCFLEVLARTGKVELVETRFREMVEVVGWEPDKYTLTSVLQSYCNSRKVDDALLIFNKINDKCWLDEHIFTILIVSLSKWGEVDRACEMVELMEKFGMRPNEKTFHVLIHGISKQGRHEKAVELFEKMKGFGLNGDLPLLSVMIEGLCEGKELERAMILYREMKIVGIHPDLLLAKKLIYSVCAEGDFITANNLLEEEGESLDLDSLVSLYNAVLDGLVSHGDAEWAYTLLRAMMEHSPSPVPHLTFNIKKKAQPNLDSFVIVICSLCKTQKLDLALVLMRDMISMGCKGKILIYNDIISELCKADRLEEAYEVVRMMMELRFEPTEFTQNSIFHALCKRENFSAVLILLKEMRLKGHVPWIKHCTLVVDQLCKNGKVETAHDFLDSIVQVGFLPDLIAYSAAINGMCKVGNVEKALKQFRNISSNGFLPDVVAYNILINGFCKAGRLNSAQEILDEMVEKGLVPSIVTYNSMIDGLCKANKMSEALTCLTKMVDSTREPNTITYTSLIDGMCSAGAPDEAVLFWNEMKEKGCAPNETSYTAIIHGLCKCGRADAALIYFYEMKQSGFSLGTYIYLLLINSLILVAKMAEAFEVLNEVLQKDCCPLNGSKNHRLLMKAVTKLFGEKSHFADLGP